MPRASIIIGLGGTGSWVLSWLKKDLLETYGSLDDIPVRLLLLDTADNIAKVGTAAGNQYSRFNDIDPDQETIRIPTDQNPNTTIRLNDDVVDKRAGVEHLSHWFCGGHFPRVALNLSDGTSQFRQLGRMALVQGIHHNGNADPVYTRLQNMVRDIVRMNGAVGSVDIDVHIVGSLAGGTGSGTFLDAAWLVRKVVSDMGNASLFLTGFFALPTVFVNGGRDMQTRAFAAWRELNRMMTVNPNRSFSVRWGSYDTAIYDVREPIYDHVYLIDGRVTDKPEDSVFPIMAEAISFFLDEQAGEEYIQHIRTNLSARKNRYPFKGRPTYSALYVKSWKQPTYHHVNVARHKLAIRYLEKLLNVVNIPQPDAAGQMQDTYQLPDMQICHQRSINVLADEMAGIGKTLFLDELARVIRIPNADRETAVTGYANAAAQLSDIYIDLPATPDNQVILLKIHADVRFVIPDVKVDGEDRDAIRSNLYNRERLLYGNNRAGGGRYDILYGDFQQNRMRGTLYKDLEPVHNAHLLLFRDRLQNWIESALNESSDGGGLACVISALEELRRQLNNTKGFFQDVEEQLPSLSQVKADAKSAFDDALQSVKGTGWLGRILGRVRQAVNAWYQREDFYNETMRNRRIVQRYIYTLQIMIQYLEDEALAKVYAITEQLVTDNKIARVKSLYRGLQESLKDEEQRHRFDQRLQAVTHQIKMTSQPLDEIDDELLKDLVARTNWNVDADMNVRIEIQLSRSADIPPVSLEANIMDSAQTMKLVQRIIDQVADHVVFNFNQQSALDVINFDQFQKELQGSKNPLYSPSNLTQLQDVRTFYIRAHGGPNNPRLPGILNSLGLPQGGGHAISLVDSDNRGKIVAFSARELLLPENFDTWNSCKTSYDTTVRGNPGQGISANPEHVRCQQLFAGEKNAFEMEYLFYKGHTSSVNTLPILNHRLVHLLEEREHLKELLKFWVLGWLYLRDADTYNAGAMWVIDDPVGRVIELAPDDDDMLDLFARYTTHGRDVVGNALPYSALVAHMNDHINSEWFSDDERAGQMLASLEFEAKATEIFAATIRRGIELEYTTDNFDSEIRHKVEELQSQPECRKTLAENVAMNFTVKMTNGDPRVSDQEAHLQFLTIVLAQAFSELAREWKNKRSRGTRDNSRKA